LDLDIHLIPRYLLIYASVGNGTFSFIPDSGFVGTIIIHAMANIKTACATNYQCKYYNKWNYK